MSLLIQLRYRIRAIETIKKITHAMRLISMSARSRLKSKEDPLREYMASSAQLLNRIKARVPDWQNPILTPETSPKPLLILIGSQRGLCGNFNTTLFHYFEKSINESYATMQSLAIIPVGKKAIQYAQDIPTLSIIREYPDLTAKNIPAISRDITNYLFATRPPFSQVHVFSNQLKTFFVQKPHETMLIPFTPDQEKTAEPPSKDDYLWEQSPEDLLDQLAYQTIEVQLHYLLFESLLAEHAARFISMDNATRNAQTLLEETQLQYNKLRQAKITKELTELTGSF